MLEPLPLPLCGHLVPLARNYDHCLFNSKTTPLAAQLDAFDFSTRSPVPMLHLLRQADVDAGEEQWFAQGGLPIQERNAAYLRGMGYEQAAALRAAALAEEPPST